MANAYGLDHIEPPRSGPVESLRAEHFLPYAEQIAREHPGYLRALGLKTAEFAASLAEPALSLGDAVESGHMSRAEAHFLQGQATAEELRELGYSAADVELILEEQRVRAASSDRSGACASSV